MEGLAQRASSISTLAVLRILHLTHSICSSLVEDLKTYDSTLTMPPASSSRAPAPAGSGGSFSAFLDRALEEMYVPWLEGTRYLECESKNLVELYAGLLSRFTRYHVRPPYHCNFPLLMRVCRKPFCKLNQIPLSIRSSISSRPAVRPPQHLPPPKPRLLPYPNTPTSSPHPLIPKPVLRRLHSLHHFKNPVSQDKCVV